MFYNLKNALAQKNIAIATFAKIIGTCESPTRNKLKGLSEFTLSEIIATSELLPEYKLQWLFMESSEHDRSA